MATNLTTGEVVVLGQDEIQDIIDNVDMQGGGNVYLQGGTYMVTSDLVIPSNIHLIGVGSSGSIIDFGEGAYQIQCIGTNSYTTGTVSISDGDTTLVGSGTSWTEYFLGASVYLQGQWYAIYSVADTTHLELTSAYQGSNLSGATYAIAVPNASVLLQGFTVQNSSTDLIKVQYAQNFSGQDVASVTGDSGLIGDTISIFNYNIGYANDCTIGISLTNSYGATITNTFLTMIGAGGGYICDSVTNSVIFDSSIDTADGPGYSCLNCTNFGVDQVSINNITGIGFILDGSGQSFSITNGLISNCTSDGMKFSNTSSQVQVTTMQFSDNGGYGVNVSDSGSTDNLFVGNLFAGNSSGAFNDMGTGTLIRSCIGEPDN